MTSIRTHADLARLIREALPELLEESGVSQESDEDLLTFGSEEAFLIHLSNGASFQINITQRGEAEDLEDEDDLAGPMTDEEIAREQEALALELRTNAYLRGELVL